MTTTDPRGVTYTLLEDAAVATEGGPRDALLSGTEVMIAGDLECLECGWRIGPKRQPRRRPLPGESMSRDLAERVRAALDERHGHLTALSLGGLPGVDRAVIETDVARRILADFGHAVLALLAESTPAAPALTCERPGDPGSIGLDWCIVHHCRWRLDRPGGCPYRDAAESTPAAPDEEGLDEERLARALCKVEMEPVSLGPEKDGSLPEYEWQAEAIAAAYRALASQDKLEPPR